jgi:acyl-CoA synthetase (AMP-forming)/AMP-acid ligase II
MAPRELLIGDVFRRNAAQVPDRPAAWMDGATWTHRELDAAGNRLAHVLRRRGIRHGDRVATWADTSLDVLPLFVALAKLGAVFAPLNARFGVGEAEAVARLARPRLLVVDAAHAADEARLRAAAEIAEGCVLGAGGELDPRAAGDEADLGEPALRETDAHVLFFTSGSTGRPKGVVLSHRANYLRSFQGVFRDAPERSVCMFPLFHMAAFTLALCAWQTRGEIALSAPTADALLETVARRRATRLYGIPAIWARILEVAPGAYDTSSLREVDTGTSAVPIALVRALKERFPGSVTRIYYGSTEVGSGATLPDEDVLRKPGSVGLPAPGAELRLTGDGEVCIRSAYLCDGYFDDPEATQAALREGWFHTGDLGAIDEDGYLFIVGRSKEIIRTGGESVVPREVEAVLEEHPAVAEVAVVGVPDPHWGEVVCAAVVPVEGAAPPTLQDLQRHCEGRLAGFKKPRRIERVKALPRTAATGQVQRALLVQQIATQARDDP